jgi:hypothetical protein
MTFLGGTDLGLSCETASTIETIQNFTGHNAAWTDAQNATEQRSSSLPWAK